MPYMRVIPRDLFNESKLLKCLGQLSLIIHDKSEAFHLKLELDHFMPRRGFVIDQDESDGALYCSNLIFKVKGERVNLRSKYNSKDPYPLMYEAEETCYCDLFSDDGSLSEGFKEWARSQI